jgi:hypothetical protein
VWGGPYYPLETLQLGARPSESYGIGNDGVRWMAYDFLSKFSAVGDKINAGAL